MCKCLDTAATYTNCSSCETLRGSCVTTEGGYPAWCDATSRCLWGDEGGPWGVTCSKTAYTFGWDSGCSRARPVDAYPTCASCVAGGYGCGAYWCASSQQCLVGDFSEWCRAVWCACVLCVCTCACVRLLITRTVRLSRFLRGSGSARTCNVCDGWASRRLAPTSTFLDCATCQNDTCLNAWCPSSGQCFAYDAGVPGHGTIPPRHTRIISACRLADNTRSCDDRSCDDRLCDDRCGDCSDTQHPPLVPRRRSTAPSVTRASARTPWTRSVCATTAPTWS
jgi:hypothetical protein